LAWLLICLCVMTLSVETTSAKKKSPPPTKIIYIPHDNRPISDAQTATVVERLGYNVVVPPDSYLGGADNLGDPDVLWDWLYEAAKDKQVKAVIVSTDSLLYGSLVGSRQHDYTAAELIERADRFISFRKKFSKLRLYAFGSIMRTPKTGEASGHMEPLYYQQYGTDIFRYTALRDKAETEKLSYRETKELRFLQELLPRDGLKDWLDRRQKNYSVNEHLIDLTRKKNFDYFVLGRDDNAPYSKTHSEHRHLSEYAAGLGKEQYQSISGIDEIGMLLLTRAVCDLRREIPFVYVKYNWGRGEDVIPLYSDEKISLSINDEILTAGGMPVTAPDKADLVLMVNTNPSGKTFEAGDRSNTSKAREGSNYFAELVKEMVDKNYPVAVADIAYANGADNAVMESMRQKGLLFRLQAYSGWNTATNSTGFAIGAGILAKYMDRAAINELLLTRYLDDWAYQANVRSSMARQLTWLKGDGVYGRLNGKRENVATRTAKMMTSFVERNLMEIPSGYKLLIDFPWNRMFEADIHWTNEITN